MTLPELSWQIAYGRLAWALVLAAVLVAAWPSSRRLSRRMLAGVVAASGMLMLLPGPASPAWHLGLAFQAPSGLLAGLCLVILVRRWSASPPRPALPPGLAAVLAAGGALLYLDAFGLLTGGYYYAGFGAAAALAAVLLAAACTLAILRGHGSAQACAMLAAVALFSLARLPTGNLWDALVDPLLWIWALVSLAVAGARALARRSASARNRGAVPGLN